MPRRLDVEVLDAPQRQPDRIVERGPLEGDEPTRGVVAHDDLVDEAVDEWARDTGRERRDEPDPERREAG